MDKKRRENFENGTADFLFTKHHSLSYQREREFRVILPNIQSNVPYTFNIGSLEDIFTVVTIDQFLDECYIQMNFKK